MILAPDTFTAETVAVGASSTAFTSTIEGTGIWLFISTTHCWISQGAAPVADPSTGTNKKSIYVPANTVVPIHGRAGAHLAVIQDAAGGKACLYRSASY